MKRSLIFILGLSIFSCNTFVDTAPNVEKELKVMVWNIWHGGNDTSLPRDGREDVIAVINSSDADVVLMIETYGSAPQIAEATDMNFAIYSIDEANTGENLCIFSKYPIIKKEIHSMSTFNFITAVIDVEGTPVRLADVWIDYLPDTTAVPTDLTADEIIEWEDDNGNRVSTMKQILRRLRTAIWEADSIPLIMGGDFNSHSHLDWTESTANLAPFDHDGAIVNWEVSSLVTEAGFTDSWREIFPEPATHYGVTWLSSSQPCRIDYIYYKSSKLKAIASETVDFREGTNFTYRGQELMYPSDHGFVMTTFTLNAQ